MRVYQIRSKEHGDLGLFKDPKRAIEAAARQSGMMPTYKDNVVNFNTAAGLVKKNGAQVSFGPGTWVSGRQVM